MNKLLLRASLAVVAASGMMLAMAGGADGRTLTSKMATTLASGEKIDQALVFQKQ